MLVRLFLLFLPVVAISPAADPCLVRTAEDFVPMTRSERIAYAAHSALGRPAFFFAGMRAGIDQGADQPKEWRQGARGFGLRMGSLYGEYFIDQVFEQGIAYARHEDNRYFASGEHGFGRRLGYAMLSTIAARRDDGSRTVSLSVIGGAAGAAFVSRAWQPRSTTSAGDAAVDFGLTLGTHMAMNIMREFSPRLLGRILQ